MSTIKEAREAVEKLASADTSDEASAEWLAGINAHCKEAGLSEDKALAVVKTAQATREQLAAGAAKNVKKKTSKAPQLDRGAAQAAKALSK